MYIGSIFPGIYIYIYGSVRLIASRFGTNVRRGKKFTIDDYMNQCLPLWGQRLCQQGVSSANIYRFGCNLKGMWTCTRHLNEFRNKPGECHFPRISHDSNGVICRSHKFVGGHWFAQSIMPGPSSMAPGARAATQANSSGTTRQLVINFTWGSYSMFAQFVWSLLRRATVHKVPIFAT